MMSVIYTESFLTACRQRMKSDIHGVLVVVQLNSEPEENPEVHRNIHNVHVQNMCCCA